MAMKQNNFYLRWQKAAGAAKSESRSQGLRTLVHRVEAAGGSGITIQFTDYNASTGELLFNANSSQVIDIPAYIRSLQNCGVFSTVSYTGYKADDDGYSIDLRCVLAAPQQ